LIVDCEAFDEARRDPKNQNIPKLSLKSLSIRQIPKKSSKKANPKSSFPPFRFH
jgi:hypothetical protein